ncbi:MAG TPA: DUF167 domain-containing protein [Tepidisphaeraceae bacterium]|nr:DUF167 domain-containing protein [Tepidisphaeraceae bacterium]
MNLLSWLLVFELLLLFSAYVAWLAGRMAARERPDDALYRFTIVFWRTLRQKPLPLKAPVLDGDDAEEEFIDESDLSETFGYSEERTPSPVAAAREAGDPTSPVIRHATVNIRVIAHSNRDQIASFDGHVLKIHVIASAEAGAANKAVIDLLTNILGVKTHQIHLVRGHFQSQKTFQISGLDQEELDHRLESFA